MTIFTELLLHLIIRWSLEPARAANDRELGPRSGSMLWPEFSPWMSRWQADGARVIS